MISGDTIAAISSAVGPAARMIVRISGAQSLRLAQLLDVPPDAATGSALRSTLAFWGLTLPSWVYLFRAPRSFTGEDIVEFHIPGNPLLAKMLLAHLLAQGARAAEPGEFTARAYFNRKLDLTEAEGVAATIAAGSDRELDAARQLMGGELSRRLAPVMELLGQTLALVEVGIDFVEENVTFLAAADLDERIARIDRMLDELLDDAVRFEQLTHAPEVVLVGRPNAGKSTLLNALVGRPRAVVSSTPGTTRDALSATVSLARGTIRLTDVAGLEEDGESSDVIERQMRNRALRTLESADVVVLVEDATDTRPRLHLTRAAALAVRSKADLSADHPADTRDIVHVSAVGGRGLDGLRARLDALCFGDAVGSLLPLNLRHVRAIEEARAALALARREVHGGGQELVAMELRESLDALGRVLGRVTPDELLGKIFSAFCIGK